MSRMEQVNSVLQRELAVMLPQLLPLDGGLVTITRVDCSPDLHFATISVSVLPEKYNGTVLTKLRKISGQLASGLRKRVVLRRLPSLHWKLDSTESEASEIDEIFKKLEEEGSGKERMDIV